MSNPRQIFEDNIRPAELLLQIYRLLDADDQILTEGEMVGALRLLVHATREEDLMVVTNELFLGLVRERAQMARSTLRRATLAHLLRQSIVMACTALDTFLPALLRANLPIIIRAVGRDFIPTNDPTVVDYFKDLTFTLDETLRLIKDASAADYISTRILSLTNFKYLSTRKGVAVVGRLHGLEKPWEQIVTHLGMNAERREIMDTLDRTVTRRNDIVHRADRPQDNPDGEPQAITFAAAKQSVDTIRHICLALDELVVERIKAYAAQVEANAAHG
ncbi:MAG: hypothetical protein HY259_04930 [Chloroflexi bacterium]|nr:hypothetical protein [Chloroflexota bacterium]